MTKPTLPYRPPNRAEVSRRARQFLAHPGQRAVFDALVRNWQADCTTMRARARSQQELADWAGVRRETANKVIAYALACGLLAYAPQYRSRRRQLPGHTTVWRPTKRGRMRVVRVIFVPGPVVCDQGAPALSRDSQSATPASPAPKWQATPLPAAAAAVRGPPLSEATAEDAAAAARRILTSVTGRDPGPVLAAAVAAQLLDGRPVRDPVAYVIDSIAREPRPRWRFYPHDQPPPAPPAAARRPGQAPSAEYAAKRAELARKKPRSTPQKP